MEEAILVRNRRDSSATNGRGGETAKGRECGCYLLVTRCTRHLANESEETGSPLSRRFARELPVFRQILVYLRKLSIDRGKQSRRWLL
jgi:hypothetical protein